MTGTHYCPQCGDTVSETDHFCRNCGQDLAESSSAPTVPLPHVDEGPPPPADGPPAAGRHHGVRVAVIIAGLAALVLLAGGAVVAFSGVLGSDNDEGETARLAAAKLPFDREMEKRDTFFQLERRYLAAMDDASQKIRSYRRDDRDFTEENKRIDEEFADEFDACGRFIAVPCPNPDYPDPPKVPGFMRETKRLREISSGLEELRVDLANLSPGGHTRVVHTQLLAAVDALKREVEHNGDVLDEAIKPAEGEAPGELDKGKLRTLRQDEALPAVKQMNRASLRIIAELQLERTSYDVPGGRDLDPADHSDEA